MIRVGRRERKERRSKGGMEDEDETSRMKPGLQGERLARSLAYTGGGEGGYAVTVVYGHRGGELEREIWLRGWLAGIRLLGWERRLCCAERGDRGG